LFVADDAFPNHCVVTGAQKHIRNSMRAGG
jgi:hypothetical protein